ncbi:MAG: hypothetical protein WDA29_10405 [Flavobacteriaceae bacterium]
MITWVSDFVNNPASRTAERKQEIAKVYRELFGKGFSLRCGSCYVSALLKILNAKQMKGCDYKLKKGVMRQGFGLPMLCSWNLTNELAEKYLAQSPSVKELFEIIPEKKKAVKADKESVRKTEEKELTKKVTKKEPTKKSVKKEPKKIIDPADIIGEALKETKNE